MSNNKNIVLDFDINVDVITNSINAMMVKAVIRYLSYHRNQIPLVYETFKSIIDKKKSNDPIDDAEYSSYIVEREISMAKQTIDKLDSITDNITKEFENHSIQEALILFGSTITTPIEIYQINLAATEKHCSPPSSSSNSAVHSLLIGLTTTEKLSLKPMPITNMFVVLRRPVSIEDYIIFQPNHSFQMPKAKLNIILNIRKTGHTMCRNIKIFNDFADLTLKDKTVPTENKNDEELMVWHDSTIFVKGYKNYLHKGKPIFNFF